MSLSTTTQLTKRITPANNFLIHISLTCALIALERELKEVRNG